MHAILRVTIQVHPTDTERPSVVEVAAAVRVAVEDALKRQEANGFNHPLDAVIALEVQNVSVDSVN